jgi:hypothetical protein
LKEKLSSVIEKLGKQIDAITNGQSVIKIENIETIVCGRLYNYFRALLDDTSKESSETIISVFETDIYKLNQLCELLKQAQLTKNTNKNSLEETHEVEKEAVCCTHRL